MKNLRVITSLYFLMSGLLHPVFATEHSDAVQKYMEEFVSSDILHQEKTRAAIERVLLSLPEDVANNLLNREFPVLFIMSYTTTIARFARAQAFFVEPDEPAVFTKGFYMITLADELETTGSVEAIAGIVAHELAHKYLEHLKAPTSTCAMEKDANLLVKAWNFEKEFLAAKDLFGAKTSSDSRCFEDTVEEPAP